MTTVCPRCHRPFGPMVCPCCRKPLTVVQRTIQNMRRGKPYPVVQHLQACLSCRFVVTLKRAEWLPKTVQQVEVL
jgi:predicted amidophosphoribosyltransferase